MERLNPWEALAALVVVPEEVTTRPVAGVTEANPHAHPGDSPVPGATDLVVGSQCNSGEDGTHGD